MEGEHKMQEFKPLQTDMLSGNNIQSPLTQRIKPFQVMVLYNKEKNHFDYEYLAHFPHHYVKEKVAQKDIFPLFQSETFIIWQNTYEQNYHLFYKLRLRAREEMMSRVTEFLVAKFFVTHETSLISLLQSDYRRKWNFIEALYDEFGTLLENETKLTSELSWNQFNKWFTSYLTQKILKMMENEHGERTLQNMSESDLNQLFYQEMNRNLAENHKFLQQFTTMVNRYLEKGMEQFFDFVLQSSSTLKSLLKTYQIKFPITGEMDLKEKYFTGMSNALYQCIVENLSKWDRKCKESKMSFNMGKMKGEMQVDDAALSYITGIEADVLDILACKYVDQPEKCETGHKVLLDDILKQRGLMPKLSGNGRRGGFEKKQREQLKNTLFVLKQISLKAENVIVYREGKPAVIEVQGHLVQNIQILGEHTLDRETYVWFSLHPVFQHFLIGSHRQTKLFSKQVITYDPYRKKWEKRLGRYLSWRWRIQARKGDYIQPQDRKSVV